MSQMKMQSIAAALMNEWWGHNSLGAPSRLSCDSDFSFALVLLSHNHTREAMLLLAICMHFISQSKDKLKDMEVTCENSVIENFEGFQNVGIPSNPSMARWGVAEWIERPLLML